MNPLSQVLILKIALAIVVWGIPLLLVPTNLLVSLGFEFAEPTLFLRLLGMAYTALVVSYAFGLQSSLRGDYPAGVVWTGIVSNGGAFLLLVLSAISGTWASWGQFAQVAMWSSLVGTGIITAGLIVFGVCGSYPRRGYDTA